MASFDYNQYLFLEDTFVSPTSRNMTGIKLSRMLNALKSAGCEITVLDLGCGVGTFTARIKQAYPDNRVVGLDFTQKALALAAAKNENLSFVCGNATGLPFSDVSIDAIGGFDILEHLENIDASIGEIRRVLKPGGMAHFHIPCEGQPGTLWWLLWKTGLPAGDLKRKHAGHVQRFTYKGVVEKFHVYGFNVINLEYSVHVVGQALDLLQWGATSVRRRLSIGETREAAVPGDTQQGATSTPVKLVFGSYRFLVRFLELISYYETKMLRRVGLAMAVDVTLKKR